MIFAGLVIASAMAVLTACGEPALPLGQQYACNVMSTAGKQPIRWDGIVLLSVPSELRGDFGRAYQSDLIDWDLLMRQRNHYAGVGKVVVPASSLVVIPAKCATGVKPGPAPTATFGS